MYEFYKNADIRNSGLFILLCIMVLASGISKFEGLYQHSLAIFNYEALFIFLYVVSRKANGWSAEFFKDNKYVKLLLIVLYLVLCNDYFIEYLRTNYGLDFIVLLAYVLLLRSDQPFIKVITHYRLTTGLLLFWLLAITISFYWSPLDLLDKPFARTRFWQTIMHVVFFIALFDFLKKNRPPLIYLLMVIPVSAIIIGLGFIVIYLNTGSEEIGDSLWFLDPPFRSHIRHIGYDITAGLAVLLPYLLYWRRISLLVLTRYIAAVFLLAFLFWCGGRASIASFFVTVVLLWALIWKNRLISRRFVLTIAVSVILAVLLSNWVSVFSWNGVFQGVAKSINAVSMNETTNAEEAVNLHGIDSSVSIDWFSLTSERTLIWKPTLAAVRDNIVFGLGSQSYYYIHGRSKGFVQPHSMLAQFLVEWGLLGGLIFLMLIILAFIKGIKQHIIKASGDLNPDMLAAGCVIASLTLHGVVDGTYYHPQPSLYLAIGFAVWLLPSKKSIESISEENTAAHPPRQSIEMSPLKQE